MTYREPSFQSNIDRGLNLVNSPIQPAIYARQKIEQEKKKKIVVDDEPYDKDIYSTKLPLIEQFVGKPKVQHTRTLAVLNDPNKMQNALQDKLLKIKQGNPYTPQTRSPAETPR